MRTLFAAVSFNSGCESYSPDIDNLGAWLRYSDDLADVCAQFPPHTPAGAAWHASLERSCIDGKEKLAAVSTHVDGALALALLVLDYAGQVSFER